MNLFLLGMSGNYARSLISQKSRCHVIQFVIVLSSFRGRFAVLVYLSRKLELQIEDESVQVPSSLLLLKCLTNYHDLWFRALFCDRLNVRLLMEWKTERNCLSQFTFVLLFHTRRFYNHASVYRLDSEISSKSRQHDLKDLIMIAN